MLTKHVSNLRRHLPLWFISLPVFTNNLQIAEHLFLAEESSQSQTFFSSFVLAQRGSISSKSYLQKTLSKNSFTLQVQHPDVRL